ncbi:DUF542 domain-containing protein [Sandaracinus amylolyticus]|uniref:Nitric oxide-dependent regulator DnrN or NorA n=1 Tax=Sandaracinus amylolyticus TaxID=927083 RepID=A0A0F6YMA3_9BACT|nr:DUF542 domain-containing protein [Sandaracinus amylolyticus]AKF10772.1 Nitric oxide-dependent regulator DnrN or NorA [Sandaracinus amylolyticus]
MKPDEVARTTIVRDILLDIAGAETALERHHVDYCCGGALALEEACCRAGADVHAVIATLIDEASKPGAQAPRDREMLSVPLVDLVKKIVDDHHARERADATSLVALARDAVAVDGASDARLAKIVALLETHFGELLPHLAFEERHVFPYVVALERAGLDGTPPPAALFATITEPIAEMIHEHETADHQLHDLRALAHDYVAPPTASDATRALYAALAEHERELVRHMHLEGNVLFPRAERLEQKVRAAFRSPRRRA